MQNWRSRKVIMGMSQGQELIHLKSDRARDNISREQYWEAVAEALIGAERVTRLLSQGTEVRIRPEGLLLEWNEPFSGVRLIFELNPHDLRTFPPTLVAEGSYEPVLSSLLFSLIRLSETFVDVGANIGLYTVGGLMMKQGIRVISYEPNPVVFSTLGRNLDLNNCLDKPSLRNVALSNQVNGSVDFFVPKFTGSGGGSMSNLHAEEGSPMVQRISTTTLDLDLQDLGGVPVEVMKVDVEGHEFEVIQGGLETIRQYSPTIIIELLRKWMDPFGTHPQEVMSLLVGGEGYEAFGITNDGCKRISEITEDTVETNFVFCHPKRQDHLTQVVAMLAK